MADGHNQRLSSVDAAFLEMESPTQHMHVGGLFLFDTSATDRFEFERFVRLVRSRLHRLPRYRQRLAYPPLGLGGPVWIDDPDFDLSYHVRHAALPHPGTMSQLMDYAARVLSRQLDRDRPLWELYVVEGLADGRLALVVKNHHAMVDGIGGVDIATVLFDLGADAGAEIPRAEPWTPQPAPSGYDLAWSGVREAVDSPAALVRTSRRALSAPLKAVGQTLSAGRAIASVASANLTRPAPKSLLNRPPGLHRRLAIQRLELADFKNVKNAFGATVNDVVLAIVADATGRYLRSRGAPTDGLWLRAMVPVSVRSSGDGHALGNQVVSVFVNLPMFEMDPVERLKICSAGMGEVKSSHHAVGAGFLIGLAAFAPPTIHAMASRLAASSRLYNFLVTNVPGPQVPVYCLGARLLGVFPFAPLSATQAYAVGVMSIDGGMNFGIAADYDGLPDVEHVTGLLRASLQELVISADARDTHRQLARKAPASAPQRSAPPARRVPRPAVAPDTAAEA